MSNYNRQKRSSLNIKIQKRGLLSNLVDLHELLVNGVVIQFSLT